jgi:hypothetical protein
MPADIIYRHFIFDSKQEYYFLLGSVGVGVAGALGSLLTVPVIFRKVCAGTVLAVTVTLFVCLPGFPLLSNSTSITPVPPGAIGSVGHFGTVQPQLPFALLMTSGSLPVFVNL